ncbi:MAG: hypothetical protein CBE21_03390, partial [Proteobacteria bacterium TMED261]
MSEAMELPVEHEVDVSWLDNMGEWGIKAEPSNRGMTLADIQVSSYGELPEVSENQTGRPRGAVARPEAYRVGDYGVNKVSEIWLDN